MVVVVVVVTILSDLQRSIKPSNIIISSAQVVSLHSCLHGSTMFTLSLAGS